MEPRYTKLANQSLPLHERPTFRHVSALALFGVSVLFRGRPRSLYIKPSNKYPANNLYSTKRRTVHGR
ncbi:hypothetical protein JZ751_016433 [Albula glossodonta]|uniref:Uncharacterized protein n=1 Tax=Albula glossodonta TaxID=121402 RepID=A0A8T2NTK7_9TELE|nr:hypothetical protein JZ751_016433 [Albula glossodonta]